MNRTVPVAVKCVPFEPDGRHLGVGEGHAVGMAASINLGSHVEAGAAARGADEAHESLGEYRRQRRMLRPERGHLHGQTVR